MHLGLFQVLLVLGIGAVIQSKAHFTAMFDNWVASSDKVKLSIFRIVDSNLMRTSVDVTVDCLIDESRSTNGSDEQFTVFDILDVH
jgi:hypothetical protein